jgi:hypothetical protein
MLQSAADSEALWPGWSCRLLQRHGPPPRPRLGGIQCLLYVYMHVSGVAWRCPAARVDPTEARFSESDSCSWSTLSLSLAALECQQQQQQAHSNMNPPMLHTRMHAPQCQPNSVRCSRRSVRLLGASSLLGAQVVGRRAQVAREGRVGDGVPCKPQMR